RKPEPRMSAGLRNLMSWLLPSLADQSCISRVSAWPLAAVIVSVMVATLVAGALSSAMASVTSWAVWYCCADTDAARSAAMMRAARAIGRRRGAAGAAADVGCLRMGYLQSGFCVRV